MDNIEAGKLDRRLESAITGGMDDAINEVARDMAGSKSPRMFRSRAARTLILMGIRAYRAEKARKPRVSA